MRPPPLPAAATPQERLAHVEALVAWAERLLGDAREHHDDGAVRGLPLDCARPLLDAFGDVLDLLRVHGLGTAGPESETETPPHADVRMIPLPRARRHGPDFRAATQSLDAALSALPLTALGGASGELKREYAALVLYVLHTRERLDLLRRAWEDPAPDDPAAASGAPR